MVLESWLKLEVESVFDLAMSFSWCWRCGVPTVYPQGLPTSCAAPDHPAKSANIFDSISFEYHPSTSPSTTTNVSNEGKCVKKIRQMTSLWSAPLRRFPCVPNAPNEDRSNAAKKKAAPPKKLALSLTRRKAIRNAESALDVTLNNYLHVEPWTSSGDQETQLPTSQITISSGRNSSQGAETDSWAKFGKETVTEVPCKSTPRTKAHTKISVKSPLTLIKHHGKSG
jgi:hypothetical protein